MRKTHLILLIVSIIIFVIGVADMPYGYYTFLRLVICGISAYSMYLYYSVTKGVNIGVVIFALLALLYNPIIPVSLGDKDIWIVVNIITSVIFLIAVLVPAKKHR